MKSAFHYLIAAVAAAMLASLPTPVHAHTVDGSLTEAQASQNARILQRALRDLHPALTKYRSQAQIDAAFGRFDARAKAARTATEMYLAATELAAAIRCGHTWTNVLNQDGASKQLLLESANKLPARITLVDGRWLVLSSADPAIAVGDEILSINGVAGKDIVARMLPYLRADGSSDGKRLRQLGHDRGDYSQMDIVWPLLSPPIDGRYSLALRSQAGPTRNASVKSITLAQRDSILAAQGFKAPGEDWTFRIEGNVGYLTLPTFAFFRSSFDWSSFLTKSFQQLDSARVPNLVIDLRANEGGDGSIGGEVLSHLITQSFDFTSSQSVTTYERVPYDLARYLDTWDFSFFDRTGRVEKITQGTAAGKYRDTARGDGRQTIVPVATPYRGRTFILVGPENSSASFQFALLAKQAGVATLVGQRTGGNQRGLNGGQLAWLTLPNSGVSVDIPLLAATYSQDTPDASVIPDVEVRPSIDALRAGRDMDMERVKRLIGSRP
ncbi:MAG: S41 family peptidase [Gammaproteobacteria bacterium]|nr:S41 family peptidase [Gammaproteobacteria bacterium]